MASYLTREDEQNFGAELLDVAMRAARHGLAPELERLHNENAQLRDEASRATKMAIDRELDANVPDWRAINADERFHSWLLQPDPYSGIIRDRLLKDAAAAASAQRVIRIFQGFIREASSTASLPSVSWQTCLHPWTDPADGGDAPERRDQRSRLVAVGARAHCCGS
jgi:hypothetical protein